MKKKKGLKALDAPGLSKDELVSRLKVRRKVVSQRWCRWLAHNFFLIMQFFYSLFFFYHNFFSFTRSKDTVASLEGLANEEHTTETNKIAAALMKKELMKSKDKVSWFIAFNFFNRFPPFFPFYSLLLLRLFRRVIPPPRGSHCWQGAQPPYHSLCIAGGSSDMLPLSHYAIFTPFF